MYPVELGRYGGWLLLMPLLLPLLPFLVVLQSFILFGFPQAMRKRRMWREWRMGAAPQLGLSGRCVRNQRINIPIN
jgi:hypothetical protein